MYLFFVFIPVMDETRDDLRRRDRTISKVEEGTIQRNCGPMKKKQIETREDGVPKTLPSIMFYTTSFFSFTTL